jgi:hypothetical protein
LKDENQVLRAYYWNKALCGAIYPAMQTLEVTFRNALNEAVKCDHQGKYQNQDWWFEHIAIDIQNKKIKKMSSSKRDKWVNSVGKRRKQSYAEQTVLGIQGELKKEGRFPILHDDVISRTTFGYWTAFLGTDYEDVTHKSLLWPNLLPVVFSNYSGKLTRLKVEASFKRIKDLRNRMSHHEPIWKFYELNSDGTSNYKQPIYGLNASLNLLSHSYNEILQAIRWMSEGRYQSFIDGCLHIEFKKLCSHDGFYGYVDPAKIKNNVARSRFLRESFIYLADAKKGIVTGIRRQGKPFDVVGINQPDI